VANKKKSSTDSTEAVENPEGAQDPAEEAEAMDVGFDDDFFAEALAAVEARAAQSRKRDAPAAVGAEGEDGEGVVLFFDEESTDQASAARIHELEAELEAVKANALVEQKVLAKEQRKRELLQEDLRETLEALQRAEAAVRELRATGKQFQRRIEQAQSRAERDVEQAKQFGHERLINQMLPVLDNLDMASRQTKTGASLEQVMQGVELIRNSFHQALSQIEVQRVEASEGTPFDPNLHEAMMRVPRPDLPDMTVIDEIRAGFLLHGRLLRAARVAVSTGGPKEAAPETDVEQTEEDSSED